MGEALELSDVRVSTAWVKTPPIPRPQPTGTRPDAEFESVKDVPPNMDRWVGFSGGKDSLAVTHFAMSEGLAHGVVYCDTGSGLAENLEYVRRVCGRYGWPLVVVPPRDGYEKPLFRYEAPGPDLHSMWFNLAKGDGWRSLYKQIDGSLKIITGVYRDESDNRMKAISDEVQREEDNFRGWYISPFFDSEGDTFEEYIDRHGLETNPCYPNIRRSGDCYCLAYAARDEILELAKHYPDHFCWIMNVERRLQEYRGRVHLFKDRHPEVFERCHKDLRTESAPPYPMLHTVVKDHFPEYHGWLCDIPRGQAVLRAMQEHTCWLGHGGTSSTQLQRAAEQADVSQMTLCDQSCNVRSVMGLSPEVERNISVAQSLQKHTQATVTDF